MIQPALALARFGWVKLRARRGEVAEWSNAPDSKSGVRFYRTVGSNPTLSANLRFAGRLRVGELA